VSTTADAADALLEREHNLEFLDGVLAGVRSEPAGRVVLVGGEAGVGKTSLVRRFCDQRPRSVRLLWGACDPLFTPRPLGPFLDMADAGLGELVEQGARPYEIATSLLGGQESDAATVVVLEDIHWADEATLDVLRLVARRVRTAPVMVLATYRDDALARTDPLRIVLGELNTTQTISRLKLEPLSPEAVASLSEPHGVDADELYRRTGGNPFFVTEVLAAGQVRIPPTVRDAVLARAARLSRAAARTLLEAVAVVAPHAELWLLEAIAADTIDHLEECLASGMLVPLPGEVAFRHELARLAIEDSLSPRRKLALHRAALAALDASPRRSADLARLAHHAEASGERTAVLEFAPAAARYASSLGSHREAAAQYARALRFAREMPPAGRAELLEGRSYECHLTEEYQEAIVAQQLALQCHREVGDRANEGNALRWLSRVLWFDGQADAAREAGHQAATLLESLEPGRELALAYANLAQLCMNAENIAKTTAWGTAALDLAGRLDDTEIIAHALNSIGTVEFLVGRAEGRDKLERSMELAQAAGLEYDVARAYAHLVWAVGRQRAHALADQYLEAGLAYSTDRDLELTRYFLLACRARSMLDRGRWTEAAADAELVLLDSTPAPLKHTLALSVLGLVRARRGDPDVWPLLDEALTMAEPSGELQQIAPVVAARAEAAWLEGREQAVVSETDAALPLALEVGAPWVTGELAYWRWQAGHVDDLSEAAVADPYRLSMAGAVERAAAMWGELGCPYEGALALGAAEDQSLLRQAIEQLQQLGARPAAAIVARRLRDRGVRGVPRGPRRGTRENPAGLTARELEVLALMAAGLRNAQIAERLVVTEKTAGHHVSAVLRKLDARTRGEASAKAGRLGLI
jgi:DNA-binding NarL/FixJ family response regulator